MAVVDPRPVYVCGEWEADLARQELRVRGAAVPVGGRAFEIIAVLIQAAGQLLTKDDLMDRVWPGAIVSENTLQVHISAVRKALGSDRAMLETRFGRGYRLRGDWKPRDAGSPGETTEQTAELLHPAQPTQSNLPAASGALVGRAVSLLHLRTLLSAYRAVTLVGPGGIGKTALALEVGRDLLADLNGEVWLVELASLSDPGLVPSVAAGALGLRLGGDEMTAQSVARAIGGARMMLVLDNCEHVIDAAAKLAETVVRMCPRATVLATSRESLRIDGEHVYRVPPLDVPPEQPANPDNILTHSAVQLFTARMRAWDSQASPVAGDLAAIVAICRHLDGIPLAIELAAARAATLGPQQVAARMHDRFKLLTAGRRTALARHQTLLAALDWSYDMLTEPQRMVLRRLAIFAGSFTLEAASAVTADDEIAASEADYGVASLVTKSLVTADAGGAALRYRLLETTRAYAFEKLVQSGEFNSVARRHARCYLDLFAGAEAETETRPTDEWLADYGPRIDNVRTALDWAFSPGGDAALGVALTVAAVPLWVQLSLLGECRERVEQALACLDKAQAASARPRMQLSAALGWSLMYGVGRAREAGPAWAATLEIAERLDDKDYQQRALWGLCIDQFNNGDFRAALDFAKRFAELVANSNDPVDLLMGDRILATALHYIGDQTNARLHIDRVLAYLAGLAQKPQIVRLRFDMRVSTHYFQARILWLQGFADQALRVVEHNIEEGRAIGHALTFCSVLGQGACPIAFLAGDFDAAARYGAMLVDHTERHPMRLWQLWARGFNGMVMAKRGDVTAGLEVLRGALDEAGEAKFLPRFLLPLGEFAACLGEAGEVTEGLAIVDDALTRCRMRDEGWYLAELLRIRGELILKGGGSEAAAKAEQEYLSALDWARQQGALFWELRAATSIARLWREQGRSTAGTILLQGVCDRFTEGFAIADLKTATGLLDTLSPLERVRTT